MGNIDQFERDITQCISNAPKSTGRFEAFANKKVLSGKGIKG